MCGVVKEVLLMQVILKVVQPEPEEVCTILYESNHWAIQPANNPMIPSNSKHFDVRHYFLREMVVSCKV